MAATASSPRPTALLLLLLCLLSTAALATARGGVVDAELKKSPHGKKPPVVKAPYVAPGAGGNGKKPPVVRPPYVAPGAGTGGKAPAPPAYGGPGTVKQPPTIPGFTIPGFGGVGGIPGMAGGWGGGWGGPAGGSSGGGVVVPSVVCSEKGPCFGKRVTCPKKCFSSYSGAGKGYGGGGGGGGCTIDCKARCTAYC